MSDRPICLICPSRDRPADLQRLATSLVETSVQADLVAYIDDDQNDLYRSFTNWDDFGGRVRLHVGKRIGPAQANNVIAHNYRSGYWIYGTAPDDAWLTTPGWDEYVIEEFLKMPAHIGVLAAAHDCGDYLNFPFVSRDWIEAAGWFAYPHGFHFCWDTILEMLGEATHLVWADPKRLAFHHEQKPAKNVEQHYTGDAHGFLMWAIGERRATVKRIRDRIAGIA